jgi:hypothetical protein
MLDYCEQILQVTERNEIPPMGMGLASSLSCMSDDAENKAATLGYQLYNEYQKGLILSNDRLQELNIQPYVTNSNQLLSLED